MADDKALSEGGAADAPALEVAAPELAPVVEPVVEAAAETPAPAESAIESAEAPATEEPAAEAALAVEPEAPAEPAAEAKPEAEAAPVESVLPTYEDFTLPEGLEAPPERIAEFTSVIGKLGLTQEAGQELMDLHAATLKQATEAMEQRQRDVFDETRAGWVKQFDKQAGNRRDTVLNDAKWAITEAVKDDKARKELWEVLAFTGAGDHAAVINAFAKMAVRMREGAAPPKALPARSQPANPADKRYGAARR